MSPAASVALGAIIMPARSVSWASSGENGALRLSLMVSGSTTSTESTTLISERRNEPFMVRWRSRLYLAAAASNGSPLWNFTPGRSFIVTVLPSAEVSEPSASCGTMLAFSSMSNSLSQSAANMMRVV